MSMTFLMMTVNAASDPRVTLRFAIMGSGTIVAMKRPPAGPPTPMPRSRRVSGRFMGFEISGVESLANPSGVSPSRFFNPKRCVCTSSSIAIQRTGVSSDNTLW